MNCSQPGWMCAVCARSLWHRIVPSTRLRRGPPNVPAKRVWCLSEDLPAKRRGTVSGWIGASGGPVRQVPDRQQDHPVGRVGAHGGAHRRRARVLPGGSRRAGGDVRGHDRPVPGRCSRSRSAARVGTTKPGALLGLYRHPHRQYRSRRARVHKVLKRYDKPSCPRPTGHRVPPASQAQGPPVRSRGTR